MKKKNSTTENYLLSSHPGWMLTDVQFLENTHFDVII